MDNPDHVAIVVHNYRWRLGLAEGEPRYAALEQRLAQGPAITVPTITIEGDANGAPHPLPEAYAAKFAAAARSATRVRAGGGRCDAVVIGRSTPEQISRAPA